tara:strand:- start:1336 stop:1476 length:141 start_codon:yes stop_codon:yes gene_type:complete
MKQKHLVHASLLEKEKIAGKSIKNRFILKPFKEAFFFGIKKGFYKI